MLMINVITTISMHTNIFTDSFQWNYIKMIKIILA